MIDIASLGLRVDSQGYVVATKRMREFERAGKKAETAAMRLARQADKVGKSMNRLGRTLSLSLTAPIAALGAASIKLGTDFDSTLTKMVTLVGLSRDEVAGFRKEILALGPAVGRGPVELADALFAVTSAGARGSQAMEILTASAKASAIGLGDTRAIALATTAAITAYGEANLSAAEATDIMIGTVEQGNLEAEELASSLGKVIGLAAQAGVSFRDVGAFVAAFTRQGVKAAEAVTGLRGTLAVLVREPTADAVKAFAELGMTIEVFREQVQQQGFIVAFQSLVASADAAGVSMARIVPEVEALVGSLAVFASKGTGAVEIAEAVGDAVGTMEQRFKDVQDLDPAFAFAAMRAEIQSLAIDLSRDLLPAVLEIVREFRAFLGGFRELTPETQTMIIRTLALTAALGPLLIVLGSTVRVLGALLPLLARVGIFLGPTGAIIVGVGTLIGLLGRLQQNMNESAFSTDRLTQSLAKLETAADVMQNIAVVDEDLENFTREREALIKKLQAMQSQNNDFNIAGAFNEEIAELRRQIELADIMIEQRREIRADYVQMLQDMAEAAGEAKVEVAGVGEAVVASGDALDVEAFQALVDALDPAAVAMRDLVSARKLLEQAKGDIGEAEYERLAALLERSALAFDAMADSIGNIRQVNPQVLADLAESFAFVEDLEQMRAGIDALADQFDPLGAQLRALAKAREEVNKAWENGIFEDNPALFKSLIDAIDDAVDSVESLGDTFGRTASNIAYVLDSMAHSAKSGSQAQRALALAAEITNTVLAIQAVLNQAQGDPYTAFGRMAAMAAAVAPLVSTAIRFAGSGGGAATRSLQQTQGTGSVLGDTDAKTESILKATEITADATSELVGINRGMLHALQALQAGIENAVIKLARGSGAEFGDLPRGANLNALFGAGKFNLFGINFVGEFLSKLFGGKSEIIDEGVRILGGTLDDIIFQAFQTVKSKKHIFASTKIRDNLQDLDDEVAEQFGLILDSIRDTVMEAAIALGIPLDTIQERLESFRIATQDISFLDLSAEEQREELLAVFGEIFDDLAVHVIPFIDQFQKVGEGLGETLVRVATSVQVFREAVEQLGFAADLNDPEAVAQMAVGLVELVGGVETFISQFTTFIDKFASDEQKLTFATDQLTRAFDEAGLVIPATRDGMVDLMMSMDASTEAGREQIATILRLAGVADAYYSLLEDAEEARLKAAQEQLRQAQLIRDFVGLGPPRELVDLRNRFEEAMAAARSLGASTQEYALIARSFNLQLQRMATQLMISIISMTQQLFGEQLGGPGQVIQEGIEETREVANSLFTDWQRALESLRDFTESLLLDDQLSPLTPAERLMEAQSQFDKLLSAAQAGDLEAAKALPDAAKALLDEARFMFASGEQYQAVFDAVMAGLQGIDMPGGIPETITEVIGGGGGFGERVDPESIYARQLQLLEELNRALLAMDLANALRDLSHVLGVSVIDLAHELGVPLRELVVLLGVELDKLTRETAAALAGAAELLGADVLELAAAVGVGLGELAVAFGVQFGEMSQTFVRQLGDFAEALGVDILRLADVMNISITDLAKTFDLGIGNFEASQFKSLAAFSDALGAGIREVSDRLGIDLGNIADATSLLSEALDMAISALPEAIQADLGPLLDAIRDATTEADANAAIQSVGNYILGLPDDIGSELIPFLQLIGFKLDQSPELSILQSINSGINNMESSLGSINSGINSLKGYLSGIAGTLNKIGGFALGGAVDRTGLYTLHAGEFVVNPTASNLAVVDHDRSGDGELSKAELRQIRLVLEDIRNSEREYHREDISIGNDIKSGVRQQAEQARRRANG